MLPPVFKETDWDCEWLSMLLLGGSWTKPTIKGHLAAWLLSRGSWNMFFNIWCTNQHGYSAANQLWNDGFRTWGGVRFATSWARKLMGSKDRSISKQSNKRKYKEHQGTIGTWEKLFWNYVYLSSLFSSHFSFPFSPIVVPIHLLSFPSLSSFSIFIFYFIACSSSPYSSQFSIPIFCHIFRPYFPHLFCFPVSLPYFLPYFPSAFSALFSFRIFFHIFLP